MLHNWILCWFLWFPVDLYSLGFFCTDWWFSEKVPFWIQDLNRFASLFEKFLPGKCGHESELGRGPVAVVLYFYEPLQITSILPMRNCTTNPKLYKSIPNCTNRENFSKTDFTPVDIIMIPLCSVKIMAPGDGRAAQSIPRRTSYFGGFRTVPLAEKWISTDICRPSVTRVPLCSI